MADIVIAIAAEVAKALVKPAIRQGQYLFCVNKVIRNLDNENKELISKRDSILSLVEQKQRTEIIEDAVNEWLNDVKSLLEEVEKLEQDVKESGCFQGWRPTWRRYRLCREISKKTERITAFKSRERFEPFSHPAPLPGIEYDISKNFTYFKSTKVAYNELLKALKDDNANMIGLYGMGGSGKTTLATEVGEKAKSEMNLFDQVISVTVSQTPNIRSIQGKMADMLNLKLEKETEEGRARELWSRLKAEKRVLIIVDDVWKTFNLKDIGICLDDNNKLNFKVLLTTREKQVCVSMDCKKPILLDLLSKNEGWSLFTKHAGIGDGSPSNLLEVARKVSDECKGLPIAIKAVGSSLKEKSLDEWKEALERLRNPDWFNDNEEEGFTDAFTCLKLSYDNLRNKKAKMLFLMCSMFPEDHGISIEYLIRYGVGLGLSGDFISFDLARSSIRAGINKLVDSCLLFRYENKERYVMMHDVVRKVALLIASKYEDHKILVNLANDPNAFAISSWSEETSLISYQLDAPRLEILLLQTWNENSLDFSFASSDGVKELKVLSIVNSDPFYETKSLLLLRSTQWLTNLRTLRLRGWKLGDLSFLISLTKLEALDLRNCNFTELPKGMEKLDRLKLLDLSARALPENVNCEVLASLSQLEELYVISRRIPSEVMKDIVTLPNLQRFWITEFLDYVYYGENNRVLSLQDFNISDFGASKQNLLQRAEHVSLQGLHGGCKNVIPDMVRVVGGMNELTELCFRWCSEIECLIDTTYLHAGSFQVDTLLPKLVRLELSYMDNLKEVCRGPPLLVLGFFEKLEQLFVRNCQHLHSIFPEACNLCNLKILKIGNYAVVSLFSVSVAQSLQKLEELSIEDCKELKHIITSEGAGGTNTGDNSHLMFPNLKKISENEEPQNLSSTEVCFPKLSELVIKKCDELKSLFSIAMVGMSPQLSTLRISEAAQLEVVFRHSSEYNTDNRDPIMLPSLKNLELEKLPSFVNIFEGSNFEAPKLQKLSTYKCPKFAPILRGTQVISLPHTEERHVFCLISSTWSELCRPRSFAASEAFLELEVLRKTKSKEQVIFHIQVKTEESNIEWKSLYSNLRKLQLRDLLELRFIWKVLPQYLSLEKLREILLVDCPKLKTIFSSDIVECLPNLRELSISNCEELEEIISSDSENAQLKPSSSRPKQEACFPRLYSIEVKQCNKLKCLFYDYETCHFPELQLFTIEECSQLEQIFGFKIEGGDKSFQRELSEVEDLIWPPKLRLRVMDCPKYRLTSRESSTSCQHVTTQKGQVFWLITTSSSLQAFLNLEELHLTTSRAECIFQLQVEGETSNNSEWKPWKSNLRDLELWNLPELRFIWKGLPQYLSLEKLEKVLLFDCPKLKTIFFPDIVKCLPNLENLWISNCEELEEIISSDSENAQLKPSSSRPKQEVCFPRLYNMGVKQCNELKCLFHVSKACHFPELQYLTIEECSQLEQAFGFKIEAGDKSFQREASEDEHLILFPKLYGLTVMDCPKYRLTSRESSTSCQHVTTQEGQVFWLITTPSSLQAFLNLPYLRLTKNRAEGIFQLQVEGETNNNSEWKPWKSNLLGLELCNLPELRFIWNGFSKYLSLENLFSISLYECPKLKTIFSSDIVRYLPNLWSLSISNCEELEEIISSDSERTQLGLPSSCPQQEVFFPQLNKIEVKQCNKLKCLFYDSNVCHFSKLKFLAIEECSQLEFGFKIEAGDTSLQRELSGGEDLIWLPKLRLTVMNCPKYSLTSNESRTSCLHNTTQKGQVFWFITASSSLQAFLNLGILHLTKSRAECIFQLQVEGEISSNNEWTPLHSSLESLRLHDLPELRFIWKNLSKFLSLEKLTLVSLVDCPQLKTIFSPYIVRCLPKLQRLSISNCEKLEEIMSSDLENTQLRDPSACPQQEVCFPQLIKIEVKQCNKLKCLFYDSMAYHFPELESLEIEECSQIEQVFGSKGRADDESSQRWAKEDGDRILLPKLRELVLTSLPIFFEISRGFNLSQPMHKYLVTDCPKYNSTFDKGSTSYQHTITQGEHSDEESQESSDEEEYSDEEFFDGA